MFEVELSAVKLKYRVVFKHLRYPPPHEGRVQGSTICRISLVHGDGDTELMSSGISYCSVDDQFNKNTGRKVAMARALKNWGKPYRRKFWHAYFETTGGPK